MQDCISSWKNVQEKHVDRSLFKLFNCDGAIFQLLDQTPMQEAEAHVCLERSSAIIDSVVELKELILHFIIFVECSFDVVS
jgi:hypothetical protein